MARLGRYFLRDQPLHLIQRGNNREAVFFHEGDYLLYREWLGGRFGEIQAPDREGAAPSGYAFAGGPAAHAARGQAAIEAPFLPSILVCREW